MRDTEMPTIQIFAESFPALQLGCFSRAPHPALHVWRLVPFHNTLPSSEPCPFFIFPYGHRRCAGLWKYHARLVRPGPISFRTIQKFVFTCPWTSTMYKVNTILYFIF